MNTQERPDKAISLRTAVLALRNALSCAWTASREPSYDHERRATSSAQTSVEAYGPRHQKEGCGLAPAAGWTLRLARAQGGLALEVFLGRDLASDEPAVQQGSRVLASPNVRSINSEGEIGSTHYEGKYAQESGHR